VPDQLEPRSPLAVEVPVHVDVEEVPFGVVQHLPRQVPAPVVLLQHGRLAPAHRPRARQVFALDEDGLDAPFEPLVLGVGFELRRDGTLRERARLGFGDLPLALGVRLGLREQLQGVQSLRRRRLLPLRRAGDFDGRFVHAVADEIGPDDGEPVRQFDPQLAPRVPVERDVPLAREPGPAVEGEAVVAHPLE
jgi:hypothetical protein